MKHLRSWLMLMLQGPAKSSPPEGIDEQLRTDHPARKGWITYYDSEAAEAHVIPIDDLLPHEIAEQCFCRPNPELIERENGDAYMFGHSSVDGRELTEPGRKTP